MMITLMFALILTIYNMVNVINLLFVQINLKKANTAIIMFKNRLLYCVRLTSEVGARKHVTCELRVVTRSARDLRRACALKKTTKKKNHTKYFTSLSDLYIDCVIVNISYLRTIRDRLIW